jgi:HK97 family phage major capsid protein
VNYTYNAPTIGSAGDVVLGPMEQYWLAVRRELTVDESDHFYFNTNERALRFVARMDGKPAIPQAFVMLAATTH